MPHHVSCVRSMKNLIEVFGDAGEATLGQKGDAEYVDGVMKLGAPSSCFYWMTQLIRYTIAGDVEAAMRAAVNAFEQNVYAALADLSLLMFSSFALLTFLEAE